MDVGIALPTQVPGLTTEVFLEWARRVDDSPFAILGTSERVVYDGWEPLAALAAAAALTTRVKLMTHILMSPLRNTGILVKQVTTIDAISNGRLMLGVGVGSREDDFLAAPADLRGRGKRMEDQVAAMRRHWAGEPITEGVGVMGPRPGRAGGPPILMGGRTPNPLRRAGEIADGYIAGTNNTPQQMLEYYGHVEAAWKDAGRSGRPLMAAINYYALGDAADVERGVDDVRTYYSFMGPNRERVAGGTLTTPEAIRDSIRGYRDIGMDDYVLMPTIPSLEQFDRLAEVVAGA